MDAGTERRQTQREKREKRSKFFALYVARDTLAVAYRSPAMLRSSAYLLSSVARRSVFVVRPGPRFRYGNARKMSTNPLHVPQGETRDEPASAAQLELANRLASSRALDAEGVDPPITKGEASDFIQDAEVQLAEAGNPVNTLKIPQGETRDEPATDKQREFAEQLASSSVVDDSALSEDMTKGEMSDFIQEATQKTAEQTLEAWEAAALEDLPEDLPRDERSEFLEFVQSRAEMERAALVEEDTESVEGAYMSPLAKVANATEEQRVAEHSILDPPTSKQWVRAQSLAASLIDFASSLSTSMTKEELSDFIHKSGLAKTAIMRASTGGRIESGQSATVAIWDQARKCSAGLVEFAGEPHARSTRNQLEDFIRRAQVALQKKLPGGYQRSRKATEGQLKLAAQLAANPLCVHLENPLKKRDPTRGEVSDFIAQARELVPRGFVPDNGRRPTRQQLEYAQELGVTVDARTGDQELSEKIREAKKQRRQSEIQEHEAALQMIQEHLRADPEENVFP